MMHNSEIASNARYGLISQMLLTSVEAFAKLLTRARISRGKCGPDQASVGCTKTELEHVIRTKLVAVPLDVLVIISTASRSEARKISSSPSPMYFLSI